MESLIMSSRTLRDVQGFDVGVVLKINRCRASVDGRRCLLAVQFESLLMVMGAHGVTVWHAQLH